LRFEPRAEVQLRGFSEPTELFRAHVDGRQ
jgi:hypothetical protein